MERLSGLDATFLYLEDSSQAMNVACMLVVDPSTVPGGYSFEAMREEMAHRVVMNPTLRRKLADSLANLDHPVWVEDDDFRIERHVHRMAIPSPGGIEEASQMCSYLIGQMLDRKKPLWDLWVLEGMADGRLTLLLRMHHASFDGATVADVIADLAKLSPDPVELDVEAAAVTTGGGGRIEMARSGAINVLLHRPLAAMKLIPKTLPVPFSWAIRVRDGEGMPAPFNAPRTRFNAPLTPRRSIAVSQLPLDDVKRVKDHFGVTLNDVVLAITAGALRAYLDKHGELPDQDLVGLVPVSVRHVDEKALIEKGTNKVTGMFTELPTNIPDPVDRLRMAGELAGRAKTHHQDIDGNVLRAFAEFAPGNTLATLMRIYADRRLSVLHPPVFNAVVSNVMGPQQRFYFLGANVEAIFPLAPIFHGLGLNITVFSAAGWLNVGVLTCPDLTPDTWDLVDYYRSGLEELMAVVDAEEADAAETP